MARPKNCRKIAALPGFALFKPAGVPARTLPEVTLTVDEFEAIRLADHEGLYQQQAAAQMDVSRQTFGRIVEAARNKVATTLVEGLALRIEGGKVEMAETRVFQCCNCQHSWDEPFGTGRPAACPACAGKNITRAEEDAGQGAGRGRQGHRGRGAGRGKGTGRLSGDPPAAETATAPETESGE